MNFLNPFALFGLAAASIPILLHLLNLRKLKTVDFSSVRFLQELQQTRVRKLRIKQILLLILRTLLVVFAVLAFARPSIPSNLPLLASNTKASVVILIDNSSSMEASDNLGQRFRQAKNIALNIVQQLRDGDEVCIVPLAGADFRKSLSFTRTFALVKDDIEKLQMTVGAADIPGGFKRSDGLFRDASYAHHEVYMISDAQRSATWREFGDTTKLLEENVSLFVLPIGNGSDGLDANYSIDSLKLITRLFNPDKPIELEAFVRNGSRADATGIPVTMVFNGNRVAQQVVDIKAGETASVILAAPTQRRGLFKVSVELEDDAIKGDNYRYVGVTMPPQPRAALIGNGADVMFVRAAFSVTGSEKIAPLTTTFPNVRDAAPSLNNTDIVYLCGGEASESDATMLLHVLERGGGVVLFAQEGKSFAQLATALGIQLGELVDKTSTKNTVNQIEKNHPMLQGVFKDATNSKQLAESPSIFKLRSARNGIPIATASTGNFITEHLVGSGKVIYVSVAPTTSWSTFPVTGFFVASMLRSSLYLTAPLGQGMSVGLNQPFGAVLPAGASNMSTFTVTDVMGDSRPVNAARTPSGTMLSIPPQRAAGVVMVHSNDSLPVMTLAVNGETDESVLSYYKSNELLDAVRKEIVDPQHAVLVETGSSIASALRVAREGSELWPLLIVLALMCAIAELMVQRFIAKEEAV